MASWFSEEVVTGLERWLKARRDEQDSESWTAINGLLDEVRDNAVEGWLPWQRLSDTDE